MELLMYWRMILQNKLIIASLLLAGVLGSYFFYSLEVPQYKALAQVFVSTPANSLDISSLATGSSFSQQRVKSYAQIVNGPETLRPVIIALKLPYSYEQLAKNVSATAPLDTVLISVTVSDPDAYLAARIANAVGQQFAITANSLEISGTANSSAIKVSMVKSASLPKATENTN